MADQDLATAAEVAKYLRTTVARLQNDRYRGRGIPFVKFGASVRYRWSDVHEWIESNLERPGAA